MKAGMVTALLASSGTPLGITGGVVQRSATSEIRNSRHSASI
jgi:hypothetical protein